MNCRLQAKMWQNAGENCLRGQNGIDILRHSGATQIRRPTLLAAGWDHPRPGLLSREPPVCAPCNSTTSAVALPLNFGSGRNMGPDGCRSVQRTILD
jgi:hypothetical protein